YLKLLRRLSESYAHFADEFESLANEGNWEQARHLAHSLKGVAGNIGAASLQQACKALEELAKEGRFESCALTAGREELKRVMTSIASLNNDVSKEVAPLGPSKALVEILDELAEQMSSYDTAAQSTFDTYREQLTSALPKTAIKILEKAIETYDFDAAAEVLRQMRVQIVTKE
ncbi:MAG: Hpt domain-containing protein, partial [Gammaproteobacteria bacterium]